MSLDEDEGGVKFLSLLQKKCDLGHAVGLAGLCFLFHCWSQLYPVWPPLLLWPVSPDPCPISTARLLWRYNSETINQAFVLLTVMGKEGQSIHMLRLHSTNKSRARCAFTGSIKIIVPSIKHTQASKSSRTPMPVVTQCS